MLSQEDYSVKDSPIVKRFVELVETYDLWKKDSKDWDEALDLNRVFWGLLNYGAEGYSKYNRAILHLLKKFAYEKEFFFDPKEQLIIDNTIKKEEDAFRIAKQRLQIRQDEKGINFGLTIIDKKVSIVASRILDETDIEYLIVINTYDKTWTKVSVRSKDSVNVTLLSGIKGHKQAGGGTFQARHLVALWKGQKKFLPYLKNEE